MYVLKLLLLVASVASDCSTFQQADCDKQAKCWWESPTCKDIIEVKMYTQKPRLFISAPHGGQLKTKYPTKDEPKRCTDVICKCAEGFDCPDDCKEKGCTLLGDKDTDKIAQYVADKLDSTHGIKVGLIINHLHRNVADMNRPKHNQGHRMGDTVSDGTGMWCEDRAEENPITGKRICDSIVLDENVGSLWDKYHDDLKTMMSHCGVDAPCLVVDIHALGAQQYKLHLGYRLSRGAFADLDDFVKDRSSMSNLLAGNKKAKEAMVGENSLSGILRPLLFEAFLNDRKNGWTKENNGVLPEEDMSTVKGYMNGGFITGRYSYLGTADSVQIETPPQLKSGERIDQFTTTLAQSLNKFFSIWKTEVDNKLPSIRHLASGQAYSVASNGVDVTCKNSKYKGQISYDPNMVTDDAVKLCAEACLGQANCAYFSINTKENRTPDQCWIYDVCDITLSKSSPKTIYKVDRTFTTDGTKTTASGGAVKITTTKDPAQTEGEVTAPTSTTAAPGVPGSSTVGSTVKGGQTNKPAETTDGGNNAQGGNNGQGGNTATTKEVSVNDATSSSAYLPISLMVLALLVVM